LIRYDLFAIKPATLDRHGLQPRDDVIASGLAFSRERSVAGGNPELFIPNTLSVVFKTTQMLYCGNLQNAHR
jgi:hypothetical protein